MSNQDNSNPEGNMRFDKIADVLKWLGHPDRLAIIKLLSEAADQTLMLSKITEVFEFTTATSSRHMSILKKIGLVERISHGQEVSYRLRSSDYKVKQVLKLINADHGQNDPFNRLRP